MADIVLIHGRRGCTCMRDSLPMLEDRLRRAGIIKKDLSGLITQGGFNKGGVAASAGTHDGGGSADWTGRIANDTTVRILRECGIAAWIRRPGQGRWPLHIHGIWNGCPHVSAGAARQVTAWKNGRNGLASNGRDDGPKVPIVTWKQALNAWTQTANATPNTGGFKPVPTPAPQPTPQEEDVPKQIYKIIDIVHGGGNDWALAKIARPAGRVALNLVANVHGPEGHRLVTRWVLGHDKIKGYWDQNHPEVVHHSHRVETVFNGHPGYEGTELGLDIYTDRPGPYRVVVSGHYWEL